MTKERIEKELQKTYAQLEQLKQKAKDLEEQKELVEKAETMKLIEKNKISSEQLQLLIRFSEQEILQLLKQKEKEENDDRIRQVHRYIKYNYMEHITVENLAAMFGFERSYLYRIFKQRYGIGPKDYLTRIRLENAKEMLARGYSVAECAYMVGYPDAFSFSKAYKNRYGIAPSHDKSLQQ